VYVVTMVKYYRKLEALNFFGNIPGEQSLE
jgi:hypothetical protein